MMTDHKHEAPGITTEWKTTETYEEDWRTRMEKGESRVVDPVTGGEKGAKPTEFARIPVEALEEVARHFHDGALKYEDAAPGVANWSLGYAWSLSINALDRHFKAWCRGEDKDPEFNRTHLAAVVFHALALMQFEIIGAGTDDRYTERARRAYLDSRRPAE